MHIHTCRIAAAEKPEVLAAAAAVRDAELTLQAAHTAAEKVKLAAAEQEAYTTRLPRIAHALSELPQNPSSCYEKPREVQSATPAADELFVCLAQLPGLLERVGKEKAGEVWHLHHAPQRICFWRAPAFLAPPKRVYASSRCSSGGT